MDSGLATNFYSDEARYQPELLASQGQDPDLVQIIQQLHESLDPRTVFACFGKVMGQYLPILGIKMRYSKYQFTWGSHQGLSIEQQLVHQGNTARLEYSLSAPLMPSQAQQLQLLQTLVIQPLFNATRFQEMSQQAMYDSLTRLGNRHYYTESLKQAIATSTRYDNALSIVILDLDNFKTLNDVHGHQFGDTVLADFGRLLTKSIRNTDQAFRVGGDEFVVVVRGDLAAAEILCRRVLHAMCGLPRFDKHQVQTSLGIAQWKRDETACSLYDRADKALYRAKAAGRRCYRADLS